MLRSLVLAVQNASEFQTWKSRPQLIHMQYAMLNEASGASDAPRLAKWQSIVMALQLSDEQKERLLAARTYLLAQMMEIIQERTLIISMLQVGIFPLPPGQDICLAACWWCLEVVVPLTILLISLPGVNHLMWLLPSSLHACEVKATKLDMTAGPARHLLRTLSTMFWWVAEGG